VATAIRFPESLRDRLRETADARQVSVNLLVTKAVDEYLGRLRPLDEIVQVG
jgi:predicted HicB family RNase H-like nuclease